MGRAPCYPLGMTALALAALLTLPAAAQDRMTFMPVADFSFKPKKGPSSEADQAATALRIQSRNLNEELSERRGEYVRMLQELVGAHVGPNAGTPAARAAATESERLTARHRKETAPLILKLTVNALRLQEYKKTGVLPESVPNEKELLAAIEAPWTPQHPEVEMPDGDLGRLKKQLERWDLKPAKRPAEALAASTPAPQVPAKPSALPPAAIQKDAGTGRELGDPVPGLIAQLSAAAPRERALAAEQLGSLGAKAAPGVSALRKSLKDADGRVRGSAALALGSVATAAEPGLLAELRALTADRDPEVRLSSQVALSRLQNP